MIFEGHRSKASTRSRQSRNVRYRQIVNRIESLVFSHVGESLRIDDFCKAAGVCERTIRAAFRELCKTTPHRFVYMLKMREARQALLSPESLSATVTQIATHFGFVELGRFSVEYRLIFGECPSETRRRTVAASQIGSGIHARRDQSSLLLNGRLRSDQRERERIRDRDLPAHLAELGAMPAVLYSEHNRAAGRA